MRKKIISHEGLGTPFSSSTELDIATIATVLVTSEETDHPIEHVFDRQRGCGGSRWIAAEPSEQNIVLEFDTPQAIQQIHLGIEELEVSRSQELQVSVSYDGGQTYESLLHQEYNFSPPGTTFQQETWTVNLGNVTHLCLRIKPDKANKPCRATLTSLVLT